MREMINWNESINQKEGKEKEMRVNDELGK